MIDSAIRRLVMAGLVTVALAAPASASGAVKVNTLSGTFKAEGVPGTGKLSFKVIVKNGEPVRVKNLVYKKLPARCNVGEGVLDPVYEPAGTLSGVAKGSTAVEYLGLVSWFMYPNKRKRQVIVAGKLNSNGTKMKNAKLEVHNNAPGACQSAVGKFTAKK